MRRARRILLAVTGLSPQVVTETVFALAVQRKPAWIPTEIRVISTSEGAERARLTLLGNDPGWFQRLRRDYGLPPIRFDEKRIRSLRRPDGRMLDDIRTLEENEAAADALLEEIRQATASADSVHVSIAGGRKTMGFFAGYALSLLGREQDALSHVLVEPPFESHPDFFYPSPAPRIIYTPPPQSRPLDASRARVTLAEIPFVRLRQWVGEKALAAPAAYARLVGMVQQELAAGLRLAPSQRRVTVGGRSITLPPAEFAFYAMVARAGAAGKALESPGEGGSPAHAQAFLEEYRRCCGPHGGHVRTAVALREGMDGQYFRERRARVNRLLEKQLGPDARPYLIITRGRRPRTQYGIAAGTVAVRFEEEGE